MTYKQLHKLIGELKFAIYIARKERNFLRADVLTHKLKLLKKKIAVR